MPRWTRDPSQEVFATLRQTSTPERSTIMPRPSYSSSFALSSINSIIRYSFVLTFNGR